MTETGEIATELRHGPDGRRVLQHSIVVDAEGARVWNAWATGEGQRRWAAPFAHVELAVDGTMEAGFRPDARPGDPGNIRDRILAYLPGRMLAWQTCEVPPGAPFDPALWRQTHQVAEFAEAGPGRTRVTQSIVGIGDGPGWEAVVSFALGVNDWSLRNLKRSLEDGPIDWAALTLPTAEQLGGGQH